MNEQPARDLLMEAAEEAAKRARILLEMAAEADDLTYESMEAISFQAEMLTEEGERALSMLRDWRLQAGRIKEATHEQG